MATNKTSMKDASETSKVPEKREKENDEDEEKDTNAVDEHPSFRVPLVALPPEAPDSGQTE